MEESDIISAIDRAHKGIGQYLEIMDLFHNVDVSVDCYFQRLFNAFYRVRQRKREWYEEYYSFMQKNKSAPVPFEKVLDHLKNTLGRYEPSFSSKLAATLNPHEPVWDRFVLKNTGQTAPYYTANNKFQGAKEIFRNIRKWYANYLISEDGIHVISTFNRLVEKHERITDIKKVDFVLWQTRA